MNKNIVAALSASLLLFQSLAYSENSGFFSNNIRVLSGSGDTLSILTDKIDNISNTETFSLSHITSTDSSVITNDLNWKSVTFDKNQGVHDMAFGAGVSVVLFDTVDGSRDNRILLFNHNKNSSESIVLPWKDTLKNNAERRIFSVAVAFAQDAFYFACNDGGLVKVNVKDNAKSVLIPGESGAVAVNLFDGITDSLKRVTNVETVKNYLIITTPAAVYLYSLTDSSWTKYDRTSLDPTVKIKEFLYASADGTSPLHPLYSIVKVTRAGNDTTFFCKYSKKENGWRVMLDYELAGLSFGPNGYLYTFSSQDSTDIKVYHDTLGDSGVTYRPSPVDLPNRLLRGNDVPSINDIQFIQKTDSSGILWVATASGLFLSKNEIPGKSADSMLCIKRVVSVKGGLKQAFASPGILKYDSQVRFVYNLSKNGKVTIRVYDYNMDLVKTIIDNQPRLAGNQNTESGRSNDKIKDTWDGTNTNGKACAPGVYYFKITTDIGEHAFGKIVVAK